MSVFPFINPETIEIKDKELPVFREYAYDFDRNELKTRDGQTYLVERNEALRIWIYFALATARYRYTAYDAGFGNEIDTLMGQPMQDEIVQAELKRYITEALMCNPYIDELSDFSFEVEKDHMHVSFRCVTVYGEERMDYELRGVVI